MQGKCGYIVIKDGKFIGRVVWQNGRGAFGVYEPFERRTIMVMESGCTFIQPFDIKQKEQSGNVAY